MKDYLINFLNPTSFTIIVILLIIAIVIIALRGRLTAIIGNKVIKLGNDSEKDPTQSPPPTVCITQKRSCGDCVLLIIGEREKYELNIRKESNKILKTQMTFAEQKLIEIQTKITRNMTTAIRRSNTSVDELVQYKLIYGLLKDALSQIKDEIRRSFKDNGFYEINNEDFSSYVKDRAQIITLMLTQFFQNMYPIRSEILDIDSLIKEIEKENPFLSDVLNEVYSYARETKLDCDNKVKTITEQFANWIDSLIK